MFTTHFRFAIVLTLLSGLQVACGAPEKALHKAVPEAVSKPDTGTKPDAGTKPDSVAPETTLASSPPELINQSSASFTFSGTDDHAVDHFECRIDSGTWQTCTSPKSFDNLAACMHRFDVKAVDKAGNEDATPSTYTWQVDLASPNTTLNTAPSLITNGTLAMFAFDGTDDFSLGGYECSLDGAPWQACTSPQMPSGIPEGVHTFGVRAIDTAGNVDVTPAIWSWTIDLSAPDTFVTGSPASITNEVAATLTFSGTDDVSINHFECQLDFGVWQSCTSPQNYGSLVTGEHTFEVRTVDDATNIDLIPAGVSWTIDRTSPETVITSMPEALTNSTISRLSFGGTDDLGIEKFECRIDSGPWAVCDSPMDYLDLPSGVHSFEVRSVDKASNKDTAPASYSWSVDLLSPEISSVLGPPAITSATSAVISFSGTDNIGIERYECRLDMDSWFPCTSPSGFFGLSTATTHVWEVRAFDVVGNASAVNAIYWDIGAIDATITSSGGYHTCALSTYTGIKCWGGNYAGQLGDNTTIDRRTPVNVVGLTSGVAAISAGQEHTCALTILGSVKCWGQNGEGALGNGTNGIKKVPTDVVNLTEGVSAISAGAAHSCALTIAGGIKCWGRNQEGQLGDSTLGSKSTPVSVVGFASGVSAVSGGGLHTCALTTSGGVRCWGYNAYGQLGDGGIANSRTPRDVLGLTTGVVAIATGYHFSCALTTLGGVKCWGFNALGQLGDSTDSYKSTPVDVIGLTSGVVAISAKFQHACVLTSSGSVKCWGSNNFGQLGDGTTADKNTSVDVSGLSAGIASISTGGYHTCASSTSGSISCWGWNQSGQLGNGMDPNETSPVDVTGLTSGATEISLGDMTSCALTNTSGIECWGNNAYGQVGNGMKGNQSTPVSVSGLSSNVTAVSAGGISTCALTTGGEVKCWGWNYYGQLGDGTTVDKSAPTSVIGLISGVVSISTGTQHSCALTTIGEIKCWGYNYFGQLGDGTNVDAKTPVNVIGMASGSTAISAGGTQTCAISMSGRAKCWGSNYAGQLGNGSVIDSSFPVDVTDLSTGTQALSSGYDHTCAINSSGGVKCWGSNYYGQLGDGTFDNKSTPVNVVGLTSGVVAISAGNDSTCAVTASGGVKCWGKNDAGQLGDGTKANKLIPVDVIGLTSGTAGISLGYNFACSASTLGGIRCWGNNNTGQLGDGTAWSVLPIQVVGF